MKVTIETLTPFNDPRGAVWRPIALDALTSQRNCHVVTSEPGAIRGNHFHRIGTEIATQSGPALVTYRDETGTHQIEVAEGEVMRFTIPPLCPHAFQNNGSVPNLLIAFSTHPWNPENRDTYPEKLM